MVADSRDHRVTLQGAGQKHPEGPIQKFWQVLPQLPSLARKIRPDDVLRIEDEHSKRNLRPVVMGSGGHLAGQDASATGWGSRSAPHRLALFGSVVRRRPWCQRVECRDPSYRHD